MVLTVGGSVAQASDSGRFGETQNGYIDKILSTTHFQVNQETLIALNKFVRTTASGEHLVCQQYVKFNHSAALEKDNFIVEEFCG
jgi:hypothetical protein